MACSRPLSGFKTGSKTETGKDDYVICQQSVDFYPVHEALKKGHKVVKGASTKVFNGVEFLSDKIPIPCGKCLGCRMDHAKEWKARCVLESTLHPVTYFITLTYDDCHLPEIDGEPVVSSSDLRKFFKRLWRKGVDFRYFACAEYGEKFSRPHYHAIIFGDVFKDLVNVGMNVFRSPLLDECWPLGHTSISIADPGTIAYVCGYCEKKQNDPLWDSYRVKPFSRMSRKPAIGFNAFRFNESFKIYGNFGSQHFYKIPRTFCRKCENESWIEPYKEHSSFNGLRMRNLLLQSYGTTEDQILGDYLEASNAKLLENKRKEKLWMIS